MSEQLIIPGTPPPPPPAPVYCTLPAYRTRCEERWHGPALQDAWANWHAFEEIKPARTEPMPDCSHVILPRLKPSGFRVSITCLDDGERVTFTGARGPFGLTVSPTLAGRKVAAVLANYRP
jgi:hypothetical protein